MKERIMSFYICLRRRFGLKCPGDENPSAYRGQSSRKIAKDLRKYAANSTAAVLDNKVYTVPDDLHMWGEKADDLGLVNFIDGERTEKLFSNLSGPFYANIPANSIVALNHKGFYSKNATWKEAVSGLTCENWQDIDPQRSVYHYFENPIRDRRFPAGGGGILELKAYGGAVVCKIGNHRLTGGMAYLTNKSGNAAAFKEVQIEPQCVFKELVPVLRSALENGYTVYSKTHSTQKDDKGNASVSIVKVVSQAGFEDRYVTYHGGNVIKDADHIKRLSVMGVARLLAWKLLLGGCTWKELPKEVLETMLDDKWLTAQFNGIHLVP
ncbi:hypothetical protein [uncultured Amphritea sp.]|uniref:hypothetical protein n=1 Tax=uncultured Amphritea sp. TaxID=981605 RepID=UPI00262CE4E7|nr:hypothetical protein [uncultured Amphritea sp.]